MRALTFALDEYLLSAFFRFSVSKAFSSSPNMRHLACLWDVQVPLTV
jgi:hypothetical protein